MHSHTLQVPRALSLPLYLSRVKTGFPFPADDHFDKVLCNIPFVGAG
jgi:hypothetical protein